MTNKTNKIVKSKQLYDAELLKNNNNKLIPHTKRITKRLKLRQLPRS